MKKIAVFLLFLSWVLPVGRAEPSAWLPIEQEVAAATQSSEVTVVHFWASWCSNCKAEHAEGGWKTFVAANPKVNVIFISVWGSAEDDAKLLASYGLDTLPNFKALRHPDQKRAREDRISAFMGLPVGWIPTTWVFKGGKLRYALNYGEVRFPMLQQLVDDTNASWSHKKSS